MCELPGNDTEKISYEVLDRRLRPNRDERRGKMGDMSWFISASSAWVEPFSQLCMQAAAEHSGDPLKSYARLDASRLSSPNISSLIRAKRVAYNQSTSQPKRHPRQLTTHKIDHRDGEIRDRFKISCVEIV